MDIRIEDVCKMDKTIRTNKKYKLAQSALRLHSVEDVSTDQDALDLVPHTFNFELNTKVKATSQFASGRCWIFAGLNVMRHKLIEKFHIDDAFELSQAHLFKYDKLEKCNVVLETAYVKRDVHNDYLFDVIISDGGTINALVRLIEKYGLIPKSNFVDNAQAKNTNMLNQLLHIILKRAILDVSRVKSRSEFEKLKAETLQTCHRIITIFLGNSPLSFESDIVQKGKFVKYTPCEFYNRVIKSVIDLKDYECICNDPRNPYNTYMGIQYIHGMLESGDDVHKKLTNVYMNVDMQTFKKAVFGTLTNERSPVWFATDFSKFLLDNHTVLDHNASLVEDMFDAKFTFDKHDALLARVTIPNHAMVFTGVHYDGTYERWKIENSHGSHSPLNGFLTMSDKFFDDFVMVAFVHKKYLPPMSSKKVKIVLPFWDVFGTYT